MEKVSVVKCQSYEQGLVDEKIEEAVNLLGGIEKFVKKGQKVALKVNLLMKATPEKAMTTHPAIVEAVVKLVQKAGATPIIVDSAGGPFTAGYMNSIYEASGLKDVAQKTNCELNQNFNFVEVTHPNAVLGFKFNVISCIAEADCVINLCKLKTHSFTGYTNAVKNLFGIIPGLSKVEMHGKYRDLEQFVNFLFDIYSYIKPKLVLNITDAVVGMEGFGPSNGTPKQIGAIIASADAVSCDVVATKIINLNPISTPIIKTAIARNFINPELEVEALGESFENMIVKDFKTIEPNNFKPYANYVPQFLQSTVHRLMTKRPVIPAKKCRGCAKCFNHCPVKAITMVKTKKQKSIAKIDYNKCIRCYCCQELCPFGVVKVKSGLIYKLIHSRDKKRSTVKK